jgi:branched-chain amino acid transport system permease protein
MSDFLNANGFLIVSMLLAGVLALSLYVPLMTGQLSLASAGFYALGGYAAAILSKQVFPSEHGQSSLIYLLLEMVIGGLLSAVVALPIGLLALRLRGIYLALATIAFVEVLRVVSLNLDITGGAVGVFDIPQPFDSKGAFLLIAIPLLVVSTAFVYRLERTRVGRAFIALREDELAAASMGISPTRYKVLAFVIGATLAGITGAVAAHFLNTWNARQGTFDESIAILSFVLVGGSQTAFGPVLGGIVMTALPELLRGAAGVAVLPDWIAQFLKDGRFIIYGVMIAVGALFFPQGLLSPALYRRLRPKRTPPPLPPETPVTTIEPAGQGL